ncbi:MAG: hypothetical protein R3F34_18595 [Planctomycetota bacterium]
MALAATLVVFTVMVGLTVATLAMSGVEVRDSKNSISDVRTKYLAEAGIENGLAIVSSAIEKGGTAAPLEAVKELFDENGLYQPLPGQPLLDGDATVGGYAVSLTLVENGADSISIRIDATGYLPDAPANLAPGEHISDWYALSTTVSYSLEPSKVFDYGYFINNWGWYYGNTIYTYGNVRSNGQFDVGGYAPTITGQPTYDSLDMTGGVATLSGYRDDNDDGLYDGEDGGVWSGWDLVNAKKLKGNGGDAANQHEYADQVPMPNLSDLSTYEAKALASASSITIGGVVMTDAVYGDTPSDRPNLYLIGTEDDPIVIDGPVVVRGDLIIGGYVTGQGSIYTEGNVYVPTSITYVNGPSSPRPDDNTQEATEEWLSENWDKDFLGLFSAENIVIGDHTHKTWKSYVSSWMSNDLNKSEEDAGEDGIPNTKAGLDGILGTADDDVLEDDGIFTTEVYTEADEALGLIPDGFDVGDVIPGTGEDIDGDGRYDAGASITDVSLDEKNLNHGHWGGNMPISGIKKYADIATLYAYHMDATFYTNHSFCCGPRERRGRRERDHRQPQREHRVRHAEVEDELRLPPARRRHGHRGRLPPEGRRIAGHPGVAPSRRGSEQAGRAVRTTVAALALLALLPATAAAQDAAGTSGGPALSPPAREGVKNQEIPPKPPEIVPKEVEQLLDERMRDRMHPGDPLDIVGIDEGAPGFRAKTPSLTRNVGSAVEIDLDELHDQRIAMYHERQATTRAPRRLGGDDGTDRVPTVAPAASESGVEESDLGRHVLNALGPAALVALAAAAYWVLRKRF